MYTAAANHPVRLHHLEKRQRRGSLPLKKRRVSVDVEFAVNGSNSSSPFFAYYKPADRRQSMTSEISVPTLTLLPSQSLLNNLGGLETLAASASTLSFGNCNTNRNDTTKLTALSLIAAAAVASQKEVFEASSLSNIEEDDDEFDEDQEEQELILATALSMSGPANNEPSSASSCSSAHQTLCQYKSCKRVAWYQNSDFCKLHARSQDDKSYKATSKQPDRSSTNLTTYTAPAATTAPPATTMGQDKRYTGAEVRCCATTTRGRACAYIAVNDTKYCHMHADYGTNPPPRRGIKSPTPTVTISSLESSSSSSKHNSPKKQSSNAKSNSSKSDKSIKSDKNRSDKSHSSSTAQRITKKPMSPLPAAASPRRSAANRAEKHADSPYPLLSMISTDQWFQRKVQVAVGPLQGRTGTVQKWGNGWISVKIPGVAGLHNRRSIELYLQDSDKQQQQQQAQVMDKKSAKKRKAKVDPPAEALGLFRCISRDVDVVSPSPSTDQSVRSVRSFTPKLTSSARSNNKFSPLPETPTPSGSSHSQYDNGQSNHSSRNSNSFLSPVPQKATAAPPKVTPLLSEDAKPVVSFKSTNCDRLQLPVTTTATMKDSVSSNKTMVFRPSATKDPSSNS